MSKITKKMYEEHLNNNSPEQGSDEWIIGGSIRMGYMWQRKYGTAIRKHDPIGFQVGFNEFKLG
jgi:hypothetical protein